MCGCGWVRTLHGVYLFTCQVLLKPRAVTVVHWVSTTQPVPTCPITMEALTDWSQIMVTSCNHLFEKYALVTWLDKNKGCPMCRTPCASVGLRRYPLYKQIYCQNDNRVGWVPFINPLTALCLVSRRGPGGGGGGGGGKELKSGER